MGNRLERLNYKKKYLSFINIYLSSSNNSEREREREKIALRIS